MPDDLSRLGAYLEYATGDHMRRRARRQAIVNAVAAVCLAVPLAIGVSAAPLAPSAGLPLGPSIFSASSDMSFLMSGELTAPIDIEHIPDERLPLVKTICLDGRDCPTPWSPSLTPAPAGRV